MYVNLFVGVGHNVPPLPHPAARKARVSGTPAPGLAIVILKTQALRPGLPVLRACGARVVFTKICLNRRFSVVIDRASIVPGAGETLVFALPLPAVTFDKLRAGSAGLLSDAPSGAWVREVRYLRTPLMLTGLYIDPLSFPTTPFVYQLCRVIKRE